MIRFGLLRFSPISAAFIVAPVASPSSTHNNGSSPRVQPWPIAEIQLLATFELGSLAGHSRRDIGLIGTRQAFHVFVDDNFLSRALDNCAKGDLRISRRADLAHQNQIKRCMKRLWRFRQPRGRRRGAGHRSAADQAPVPPELRPTFGPRQPDQRIFEAPVPWSRNYDIGGPSGLSAINRAARTPTGFGEPPHLDRSTIMFRKRRTENGEQATQARGNSSDVAGCYKYEAAEVVRPACYRKNSELLHVEGWKINHKKDERLRHWCSQNSKVDR